MKKFGLSRNPLTNMWASLDAWPFTVWDISIAQQMMRVFKGVIGDQGEFREGCDANIGYKKWFGNSPNNVSIFNPGIIALIFALYGEEIPKGGNVYDPFGGGGTRALACASNGLNYVGVEIRDEEVQGIRSRIGEFEHGLTGTAHIIHGDARDANDITDNWADIVITCPPYYNLEPYHGGEFDLSMCTTYENFLLGLEAVVVQCQRILKPGGLAFWVVGLHRDQTTKALYPLNHDLSTIHRIYNEWHFREEIILHRKQTSAAQRVGMFGKGNRLLIRTHEYLLVYRNDKEA